MIQCYDMLFLIWNRHEDTSADFANLLVASPFTQPFVSSGAECMPLMKSHENKDERRNMHNIYIYIYVFIFIYISYEINSLNYFTYDNSLPTKLLS